MVKDSRHAHTKVPNHPKKKPIIFQSRQFPNPSSREITCRVPHSVLVWSSVPRLVLPGTTCLSPLANPNHLDETWVSSSTFGMQEEEYYSAAESTTTRVVVSRLELGEWTFLRLPRAQGYHHNGFQWFQCCCCLEESWHQISVDLGHLGLVQCHPRIVHHP